MVRFRASERGPFVGSLQGGVGCADFGPDLGSDSGLDLGPRSGSVWGPIWGPSGGGHFRLRSFSGPPHTRICFIRRSLNFHILKMGVFGGARFSVQKNPSRELNLGSDLGSSRGPRSGSIWGPSGVPFGPPKVASFSGAETRPKRYIYNGFSDFRTLEKGLKSDPLEEPHLASRGPKNLRKGGPEFPKTL